jgi:hypothetical protein
MNTEGNESGLRPSWTVGVRGVKTSDAIVSCRIGMGSFGHCLTLEKQRWGCRVIAV